MRNQRTNRPVRRRSRSCDPCRVAWFGTPTCWSCGKTATSTHRNAAYALNALFRSIDRKKTAR